MTQIDQAAQADTCAWAEEGEEYQFAKDPVVVDLALKLAAAERQAENLAGMLVQRELVKVVLPGYAEAEAAAGREYSAALAALREPGDRIGELKEEIAKADEEFVSWRDDLDNEKIGARVAARTALASWREEMDALTAKLAVLEAEIQPLRLAAAEAKTRLDRANEDHELAKFNAGSPFAALLGYGQDTDSFRTFWLRGGHFVKVLLSGNTIHAAWNASCAFMDELALRSGWRSDHLPKEADYWREHWDDIQDRANITHEQGGQNVVADRVLSGAEEVASLHLEGARMADHARNYRPPQKADGDRAAAASRNERVSANGRPEMQWKR
jgi:hypothetical protein